jgi:hypothetical protein
MGEHSLIDCLAQVLNILHQVNGAISQSLRHLSMGQNADKLEDDLVLS